MKQLCGDPNGFPKGFIRIHFLYILIDGIFPKGYTTYNFTLLVY